MASTSMLTVNALTVKKWAMTDWLNPGPYNAFGHMVERGAIYYADELTGSKARGDQITFSYVNKLTGIPIGEGGTLDGNEEALNLGSFSIAINVTRVGVLNPNSDTIEQQRTLVDFPARSRRVIANRHAELMDISCFTQLASFNPTSFTMGGTTWSGNNRLFVQGQNTPPTESANRFVRAGAAATDQALTASNTMTLDLVDFALERNALSQQPLQMFNDNSFDLFVSPEQYVDLKQDTSGKIQWFNIELAKITGGKDNELEDMIWKGMVAAGQYSSVYIYSAQHVAYGVNSSTSAVITSVRRAVLVGKDALTYASPYGRPKEAVPLVYADQLKDYGYYKGLEGRAIYGIKQTTPSNGDPVGVIVIPTYAAAHS